MQHLDVCCGLPGYNRTANTPYQKGGNSYTQTQHVETHHGGHVFHPDGENKLAHQVDQLGLNKGRDGFGIVLARYVT